MKNSHTAPAHIFTTHLSISHILISHEDSNVILPGVYGDLADGEFKRINVETNFQALNNLIAAAENNEEVIKLISNALSNPTQEIEPIDIADSGGLNFHDYFFSFQMIRDEEEVIETTEPEDISYWLNGCIKIENHLPCFIDFRIPENKQELIAYYNKVLAMQYRLYLSASKKSGKQNALIISCLTDPIFFAMAKAHFELEQ